MGQSGQLLSFTWVPFSHDSHAGGPVLRYTVGSSCPALWYHFVSPMVVRSLWKCLNLGSFGGILSGFINRRTTLVVAAVDHLICESTLVLSPAQAGPPPLHFQLVDVGLDAFSRRDVEQMSSDLKDLEKLIQKREDNRSAIIGRRISGLTGKAGHLEW